MVKEIKVKSFNGIGDCLMASPAIRVIKETYWDDIEIVFNTNYPEFFENTPYCHVGSDNSGLFLGYPDPIHRTAPMRHHIISDWRIICDHYELATPSPETAPQIFAPLLKRGGNILVQVLTKPTFSGKKSWPHLEEFLKKYKLDVLTRTPNIKQLVDDIAQARLVVCMEGGVHHIAKAVGTPAVVIYGGFMRPEWTGYPDQFNITRECPYALECYNPDPCKHPHHHWCMDDISPGEVWEMVQEALATPVQTWVPKGSKLNLGSGDMLLDGWVNFDRQLFMRHGLTTNCFGRIEHIGEIFPDNWFSEILCAHVIEHFYWWDSVELLKDMLRILQPGGKAVLEGPDILGTVELFHDNHRQMVDHIFACQKHVVAWGEHWAHKSGWTTKLLAQEMDNVGFNIVEIGHGRTHGMGKRDFRVVGEKPK